jgi:hypothetical protein
MRAKVTKSRGGKREERKAKAKKKNKHCVKVEATDLQ